MNAVDFTEEDALAERGCCRWFRNRAAGKARKFPPPQRHCPYCDGPLLGFLVGVPDWRFHTGVTADVYRCTDCGALAAGRLPRPEELTAWYSGYYTHGDEPSPSRAWSTIWPTPRRRREIQQLRWYLTPPAPAGRLLEVGAGAGERLVQFAEAGWDAVGQDPDPEAGKVAKKRGLKVYDCPVRNLAGREESFDLIGLNHVIEHVLDPAELLQACVSLLRPGGRLCVISPNAAGLGRRVFGRWWFGLEQPRHLAIPTLGSLERVTAPLGLRVLYTGSVATNGTVILGGSLAGRLGNRLPHGPLRKAIDVASALLGQAMARLAVLGDSRLGEEVVWLGQRPR